VSSAGVGFGKSNVRKGSWAFSFLALAGAYSCSVFPDQAQLPRMSAGAGSAGEAPSSQAGLGGAGVEPTPGAGAPGVAEGGAPGNTGGAPDVVATAGAADTPGGAGGAPASGCLDPQQQVVAVTIDTWIESAKPSTGHGNDKTLSVVGGGQERRALLGLDLSAVVPGAVVLKATLALHLQANADVGLAKRQLRVHRLAQEITEARTTWNNYAQGNRTWTLPGGDFGPVLAQAAIPAGTADGALTFNVTAAVRAAFSAQTVPLAFIILESSAPPAAPAELAFTSRQGDASGIPALIIEYCPP
jgi:hypothetical protein